MLILDTDHLSEIERGSPAGARLMQRLGGQDVAAVATIISAEEQLRGWLAQIHGKRSVHNQLDPYRRLQGRLEFYAEWTLLPWTIAAADRFVALKKGGVRMGSMDLKIASIALENNGIVLSQNFADFSKVPGLKVENWL